MTLLQRRKTRQQLYKMLAMMHAGPLGYALAPQVRRLAAELWGDIELPEVVPPPPELYRWNYGFCSGSRKLGCQADSPKDCLVAKLLRLAQSAAKGAKGRRLQEAQLINDDLLPCMREVSRHMQDSSYQALVALTCRIVQRDAAFIREHAAHC